jgi:hypothetical protein
LENKIKIVKAVSRDSNMDFGLEKCAKISLKKGRVQRKPTLEAHFRRTLNYWT